MPKLMLSIFVGATMLLAGASASSKSCTPVDQRGQACIHLTDSGRETRSDGRVIHKLVFENRCDRSISVKAQRTLHLERGDDGVSGTGVGAGRKSDLICIDDPSTGKKCAGFNNWWVECY